MRLPVETVVFAAVACLNIVEAWPGKENEHLMFSAHVNTNLTLSRTLYHTPRFC